MDITTFVALLIILQWVCLWAGKRAANNLHSQEDYFLASKVNGSHDVCIHPI